MSSVNKAILIGNLGKDPESRFLSNGDAVTNITLATTDTWKDKNGEKQSKTEWHNIVFYKKLAEIVSEYCLKGQSIYIEGRLETKKWTDKSGVERYTTQIVADQMKMLGSKPSGETREKSEPARQQESKPSGGGFDDMDDDIPF